jgi:hypothetical protein
MMGCLDEAKALGLPTTEDEMGEMKGDSAL